MPSGVEIDLLFLMWRLGLQNVLGLVSAGGLGGWVYLQRGDQQRQDASRQAAQAAQRAEIDGLSSQVCICLL